MEGKLTSKEIHAGLRKYRGSITEVANRLGRTPFWVWRVLDGRDTSDEVLVMAATVLLERRKKEAEAKTLVSAALVSANSFQGIETVAF